MVGMPHAVGEPLAAAVDEGNGDNGVRRLGVVRNVARPAPERSNAVIIRTRTLQYPDIRTAPLHAHAADPDRG